MNYNNAHKWQIYNEIVESNFKERNLTYEFK